MSDDLNVTGIMTLPGGEYGNMHINGILTIRDSAESTALKVNGTAAFKESLKTGEVKVNGTVDVDDCLTCGDAKVNGQLTVKDYRSDGCLTINGTVSIKGSVETGEAKVWGGLYVTGGCDVEKMKVKGAFEIGGMLNCGELDIEMYWHTSKAGEVGCEKIRVKQGNDIGIAKIKDWISSSIFGNNTSHRFVAGSIEGDEISLEYTKADIVRGRKVYIGEGCDIGTVEYSLECNTASGANVGEKKKV